MLARDPGGGSSLEQAAAGSTVDTPDQVVRSSSQERIMHS